MAGAAAVQCPVDISNARPAPSPSSLIHGGILPPQNGNLGLERVDLLSLGVDLLDKAVALRDFLPPLGHRVSKQALLCAAKLLLECLLLLRKDRDSLARG